MGSQQNAGSLAGCFAPGLATLRSYLTAILARIRELRVDRPTVVRVTGYWDVCIDGDVAAQTYGSGFQANSTALTLRANTDPDGRPSPGRNRY